MLTFTFLGVGGAFAKRNHQSNVLVEAWATGPGAQDAPDDVMLIDFGSTGPIALHELRAVDGFQYLDRDGRADYTAIRRVLITHLHGDHIGGLEELAFSNMFLMPRSGGKSFKPQLVADMGILVNLWDHALKAGLSGLEGRHMLLQDYFFVRALKTDGAEPDPLRLLKRYEFSLFPTDHLRISRKYDWPSFGVTVTDRTTGETAFFSGDTKFDYPAYSPMLHNARVIFHEAQLEDQPAPVHSLLSELRSMPADVRKKTFLYHYGDDWDGGPYDFVADEFAGFAEPRRRYVVFD